MADLVINKNSYVTLDEANQIVADSYLSTSAEVARWGSLSDADKIVALTSSAKALNNLRYKGRKMIRNQPLAFPRVYSVFPGITWMPFISQYYDSSLIDTGFASSNGLEEAKLAQVKNAVAGITLDSSIITDTVERSVQGILSRRRNSISETYDSNAKSSANKMLTGIYNYEEIKAILIDWFSDSVYTL